MGVKISRDESVLEQGTMDVTEHDRLLEGIPSHKAPINGTPAADIRGVDNILFYPIVQMALTRARGKLAGRVKPKEVIQTLADKEIEGQLKLRMWTAPWFGVLCNASGKMHRHRKNENRCCRLLMFLLGGVEDDVELERLGRDFAEQRVIDHERGIGTDLEGKPVRLDEFQLTNPWR